ncbi:fructokinase [Albimonas donghaensis]|uniref:Fructokinase n=1 Tax=Albimonas donghaensis TaxID=356660 RepID=A0A1H2TBM5_9RHOB|nr:ROK family protein [Albimonas donghaensis]SDW41346.1 fructokinase [Albimonas donghaensis]
MRIGVDFGGTKIEGVALAPDGTIRARQRVETPRGDYDGSVRAIRDLVLALEAEAGARAPALGVGIPGSLSPATRTVRNGNAVWLIGKPFDTDLAEALSRPVRMANDANCFALSEAADGAGAGAGVVFGTINGTGVGGGLIVDGRIVEGRNGIGGEWGHNALPLPTDAERPGPHCFCGRRGCLEVWISGTGLEGDFARAVGAGEGQGPAARDIAEMAADGDPDAEAAMDRLYDRWGRALSVIVNVVDPDVVVLGGGLSNLSVAPERISRAMRPHVFSDVMETEIRRALHGDSSGVRGAAWLWDEEETA